MGRPNKTKDSASRPVLNAKGYRFAIIVARFNSEITESLCGAAQATLLEHGCGPDDIKIVQVPGAWEIPVVANALAGGHGGYHALIACACVIRGDTMHFEIVANEASRGIMTVSTSLEIPIGNAILACENMEQAKVRSGSGEDNKGREAALAAIEMAMILDELDEEWE